MEAVLNMKKNLDVIICPDCNGKKVIVINGKQYVCSFCNGLGTVPN
jgi:Zn finger protein HypA/HybF involved in hydrogenase expression